ncbi:helix-turn-helix domain-containing protein [Flavobacterium salmonis]|nr:AraC family transcriptional regulator [Flavobacterium salmonis]
MEREIDQQRMRNIYHMLLEMSVGNFTYRIPRTENDDDLEGLAVLINMLAEEMKEAIFPDGYINKNHTHNHITETKEDYKALIKSLPENSDVIIRSFEARLIQNVYDYIIGHLDTPLPSLRELSQIFGINEFKLKQSFRELFRTSIYQFYNEQRLKKAHLLIEQSVLPLKEIAYISGFSTYANFSKSFKKKFDYAPNRVKRQARTYK